MPSKENLKVSYNQERARFEVESETYTGHKYSVKFSHYHDCLICTCPWGRGRAIATKKDCKHVKAVRSYIEEQNRIVEELTRC